MWAAPVPTCPTRGRWRGISRHELRDPLNRLFIRTSMKCRRRAPDSRMKSSYSFDSFLRYSLCLLEIYEWHRKKTRLEKSKSQRCLSPPARAYSAIQKEKEEKYGRPFVAVTILKKLNTTVKRVWKRRDKKDEQKRETEPTEDMLCFVLVACLMNGRLWRSRVSIGERLTSLRYVATRRSLLGIVFHVVFIYERTQAINLRRTRVPLKEKDNIFSTLSLIPQLAFGVNWTVPDIWFHKPPDVVFLALDLTKTNKWRTSQYKLSPLTIKTHVHTQPLEQINTWRLELFTPEPFRDTSPSYNEHICTVANHWIVLFWKDIWRSANACRCHWF